MLSHSKDVTWMLPHMVKSTLQMQLRLQTLGWEDYPVLSKWIQSDRMSPLKVRTFTDGVREKYT